MKSEGCWLQTKSPKMRTLSKIILHCSATKPEQVVNAAVIDGWHKARGWQGVGYHFIILPSGVVELGRPLDQMGAHCRGQNEASVGVCYVGGLNYSGKPEDTMTGAQEMAWMQLVRSIRLLFGWMPVHGHNEFSAKACPSFDVREKYGWMNQQK